MSLSLAALSPVSFLAPSVPMRSREVQMVAQTPKPLGSDAFCYGLPGAIEPVGEFDPLGFTKDADVLEVNRLRESELTHGRVGMLAAAGFLVQEKFHPLFGDDGGPAIEQVPQLPPGFLVALAMAISATEAKRIAIGFAPPTETNLKEARAAGPSMSFQRLRPEYVPGDLGFDPLGLKPDDPEEFRLMQERELSHGRLGMIAAAGMLAQEAVSGDTWGTWWGLHPQLDGGLIDASF
jgi:hypothetical protein